MWLLFMCREMQDVRCDFPIVERLQFVIQSETNELVHSGKGNASGLPK